MTSGSSIPAAVPGKCRLGVLTTGSSWPAWQLAALRGLLDVEGVELVLVLEAGLSPPAALAHEFAWPPAELPPDPASPVSVRAELDEAPRIRNPETFLEQMESHALDLIWCTEPALASPALGQATRGGLWMLEVDGGDPACVHAVLRGASCITARLLRMATRSGRARVLAEAHFRNEAFSPGLTRARVLYGCAALPARQLRSWLLQGDGALGGEEISIGQELRSGPLLRMLLPLRQLASLGRRLIESCYRDQWTVGWTEQPIEAFLHGERLPHVHWLTEEPGGDFHADPFGFETPDGLVLLAEGYRADRAIGRVDALSTGAEAACSTIARDVMPPACHISYPYLLAHDGEIYCVPETWEQRCVALYRGDPFPERWVQVATLVERFAAIDPTVFEHEGRWWLLCGNQDDGPYEKLFGFMADTLMGPWHAHPLNPLKCDPRSTRPAGTPFRHAGALYRPAQDCSRGYGGAVVINRIETLTPTAFAEVPVKRVDPDAQGPYPHGLHTLAAAGSRTLLDGKRLVFSPAAALRAGRHFLGRLRAQRARPARPAAAGASPDRKGG